MGPRFLLVSGQQSQRVVATSWPGSGRNSCARPVEGAWLAWRLVGRNHRELARSPEVYSDVDLACAAIAALRDGLDRACAVTEPVHGLWAWQLSIDDQVVAVAGRLFQRPRECAYNLAAATEAMRIATVRTELSGRARGDLRRGP